MGESPKSYPEEFLRAQLLACGLPREMHYYEALRAVFGEYFKGPVDSTLESANALAKILIYLHQKKVLSLRGKQL